MGPRAIARGNTPPLGMRSRIESFGEKRNSRITQYCVVQAPTLLERHRRFLQCFWIGREPEKSLLGETAEGERFSCLAFKPSFGGGVM